MRANFMRTTAVQSAENIYYLPRKSTRAAMARFAKQRSYEFLKAGFYLLGGAFIGFALANLPALSAALAASLNVLPPPVM